MRYLACLPLWFAATLHAQSANPLAYPQDALMPYNSNAAPLGGLQWAVSEARTQLLFPADHLPSAGGMLVGIAVHGLEGGTANYLSLNMDASIATATSLSTVFAQNLLGPVPVLAAQNLSVTYTSQAWTPIMFTTPFVYPGSLNLVLDIRKVLPFPPGGMLGMQTTSNPPRYDLPPMVYAYGALGSGASTATTATDTVPTLQLRLLWAGTPTMTVRSDPMAGSPNYTFSASGGSITITTYGTPASLYLTQAGFGLSPVWLPPVSGLMYVSGVTLGIGFLNTSGNDQRILHIPVNPALVSLHIAFQSGVLDALTSTAAWTPASDAFIFP